MGFAPDLDDLDLMEAGPLSWTGPLGFPVPRLGLYGEGMKPKQEDRH